MIPRADDKWLKLESLQIETLQFFIMGKVSAIDRLSKGIHLSSALGIKTITLMVDTPIIYGSYSSIMFPIIPDGETTVTHDSLGKDKINPEKIFNKFMSILN